MLTALTYIYFTGLLVVGAGGSYICIDQQLLSNGQCVAVASVGAVVWPVGAAYLMIGDL